MPGALQFWDINTERHQIISNIIGNSELKKLHDLYYYKVSPFWFGLAIKDIEREMRMLKVELEETVVWMKSGDMKAVASINRNHISYGMIRLQQYFNESNSSDQ